MKTLTADAAINIILIIFSVLYGTGVLAYAGKFRKFPGLKYFGFSYFVYAIISVIYLPRITFLIVIGNMLLTVVLILYILGMEKFLGGRFRYSPISFLLASVFTGVYAVPSLIDNGLHYQLLAVLSAAEVILCISLLQGLWTRVPRPMNLAYKTIFWSVFIIGAQAVFRIYFDAAILFGKHFSEQKIFITDIVFFFLNIVFIITTSLAVIWLTNELLFDELREQARRDPLTDLLNRRALLETAEREMKRAARYGLSLSSIMVDLDDFKQINDTYGHIVGDRILAELAAILQKTVRQTDFIFRYGGEEFMLLLVETDNSAAQSVAEKILSCIRKNRFTDEHQLELTASLGVASRADGEESWERLVDRSDQAMYEAKKRGRNNIVNV